MNTAAPRTGRQALLVIAVTAIFLVPFCDKAFHIDDTLFLWKAQQIAQHPGDFYGFEVNRDDHTLPVHEVTQNPPLAAYFLAAAGLLVGWSEVALHLACLLPALLVTGGTFLLARRYCARPVTAALVALATPVFLVSATTVMCDVTMLALWVWSVIFWLKGLDRGSFLLLLAAALLAAAAALAKYYGLALVPLLLAATIRQKKGIGAWALFLLIPPAAMLGYEILTRELYGIGLVSNAASYSSEVRAATGTGPVEAFFSGLAFTGGCLLPALFLAPLLLSRRALGATALLTAAAFLCLLLLEPEGLSGEDRPIGFQVQFALQLAAGGVVLFLALDALLRFRDGAALVLALWVLGTFIFAAFLNWTMNGRSVLPLVPAAAILIARRLETRGSREKFAFRSLLPAAAVALLVTAADAGLAGTARSAAQEITTRYASIPGRIWFGGHWGFQYYMEKAGARPIDLLRFNDPRRKMWKFLASDVAVIPSNAGARHAITPSSDGPYETLRFEPIRWCATMSRPAGAGFYSARLGPLPFVFGPVPVEEYAVYAGRRVRALLPLRESRAPSGR